MANLEIVIDGDGHIFEDAEGIRRHLKSPMKDANITKLMGVFPQLDHLHHSVVQNPEDAFGVSNGVFKDPGVTGWGDFMNKAAIESAVLYPTAGLSYGKIIDLDFAIGACQAYNDWITEAYTEKDNRLHPVALIPMQEPDAAVEELRRVKNQLGMCAAMLPSTGLSNHLGAKMYWPIYEEAERLGIPLAVHGGAHHDLGMNTMNVFAATHAIGHPMGIMIGLAGMLFNGVFDRFPNLRVGFLEGGVAWFLMALERFSGSYHAFTPFDPRDQLLKLPENQTVADYLISLCKQGRVKIGVEGDEQSLAYAVHLVGQEAFIFSSDFPHEVNLGSIRHEIEELIEIEELTAEQKEAILWKNSLEFYGLQSSMNGK
ncbi:MAG: amidohydrolase [Dehalococcoidia bacterium]|jgi:predicted TIM-barrel fold metal-dependent hydrolase|nr:amidohydrolase [Dehalococcoidia bacterium]